MSQNESGWCVVVGEKPEVTNIDDENSLYVSVIIAHPLQVFTCVASVWRDVSTCIVVLAFACACEACRCTYM